MQQPGQEFTIQLTDPARIDKALKILSGEENNEGHVMGLIIKRKAPCNPAWDFHLDPQTISFFAMAIEVCDANMQYVETTWARPTAPFSRPLVPAGFHANTRHDPKVITTRHAAPARY
jgi:hypothetical protein